MNISMVPQCFDLFQILLKQKETKKFDLKKCLNQETYSLGLNSKQNELKKFDNFWKKTFGF
jgi:hypothetical protein